MTEEALTEREIEVLEDTARGMTAEQIAALNHGSEATVRTQLKAIREKLHAENTAHAVALAIEHGIIRGPF